MFFFSPLEQFNSYILFFWFPTLFGKTLDLSFSNVVLPIVFLNIFLFAFFLIYKSQFRLIPTAMQLVLENIYIFLNKIVIQQTGYKGLIYFPFIVTLFFFVLFSNLLGLLPFGFALTSHIIMIFLLSFTISLAIFQIGFLIHGLHFLKLFAPDTPLWLLPLLIFIEIFSYMIRAISLAVRLAANVMSGHVLFFILLSAMINFSYLNFWHFFAFSGIIIMMAILELAVACLQAYVFVVLVCIYFSDSINLH